MPLADSHSLDLVCRQVVEEPGAVGTTHVETATVGPVEEHNAML
jgi:hypothetical protein